MITMLKFHYLPYILCSLAVLLPSHCDCREECYVTIEAEKGSHTGRVMERDKASNDRTVLLTAYESVIQTFKVFHVHVATVAGVSYSNDGESDNFTVSIDGKVIEVFETREDFGEGHLWNVFLNTGRFEDTLLVKPGDHEVQILVISQDVNGVEIDSIILELNCSDTEQCPQGYDVCPESVMEVKRYENDYEERMRVLLSSSENILGLTGSILGLINTSILVILTCYKCMENRKKKKKGDRRDANANEAETTSFTPSETTPFVTLM